jgi:glucosamine 6-phosphate synthetase-like amidotransferase/phosphosugar isomerase protein
VWRPAGLDTALFEVMTLVPEVEQLLSPQLNMLQMQLLIYNIAACLWL